MSITLHSGISCDGIKISIVDENSNVIFKRDYSYGWDLSHSAAETDPCKPYTSNLIKNLMETYDIQFMDIETLPGIFVFSGEEMTERETNDFKERYLSKLKEK